MLSDMLHTISGKGGVANTTAMCFWAVSSHILSLLNDTFPHLKTGIMCLLVESYISIASFSSLRLCGNIIDHPAGLSNFSNF